MSDIEQARRIVERIVRAIVDDTEAVHVDADGTTLRIHVDPSDTGKVIGQRGRTARSLRVLVSGVGMKTKTKFSVDIIESARP